MINLNDCLLLRCPYCNDPASISPELGTFCCERCQFTSNIPKKYYKKTNSSCEILNKLDYEFYKRMNGGINHEH
jgi:hypothetical protein